MRNRYGSLFFLALYFVVFWIFVSNDKNASNEETYVLFDLVFFLGVFLISLFIYSQVIIPINSIHDRLMIFKHSILHLLGIHGVPQRIENGRLFPKTPNPNLEGPTILLVDTASAGIIQDDTNQVYPIGPGIHFTRSNASVIETAPLFPQQQTIGPLPGEDPFTPFDPQKEEESAYELRQTRRLATIARTRDGIEISPTFTVQFGFDLGSAHKRDHPIKFGLNTASGPGQTEFGFNAESILKALINNGTSKPSTHSKGWRWIPGRLVTDIWREYIGRFTFAQLFPDEAGMENMISTIVGYIRARLQSPNFLALDSEGRLDPSSAPIPSREFNMLKANGLRVDWVRVDHIHFPPDIERQLIQNWLTSWSKQAEQMLKNTDMDLDTHQGQVQSETIHFFANGVTRRLGEIPPNSSLPPAQILNYLIRDTLDLYSREPALHQTGQNEINHLRTIQEWINERQ